jgi:hypothetical protein
MSGIIAGVVIMALLLSTPVLGKTLQAQSAPRAVPVRSIPGMGAKTFRPANTAPPIPGMLADARLAPHNTSTSIAALLAQVGQQPANVNGRLVYAIPAVVGPDAAAILQNITADAIVYVVHPLAGWGKSVSTTVSWFRCGDIVSVDQYNGSQVEIENWVLLTQQERMEAQAACSLSSFAA